MGGTPSSTTWKDLLKHNHDGDVFMGSAELTKVLAVRLEDYQEFCDAIGLNKTK